MLPFALRYPKNVLRLWAHIRDSRSLQHFVALLPANRNTRYLIHRSAADFSLDKARVIASMSLLEIPQPLAQHSFVTRDVHLHVVKLARRSRFLFDVAL